MIVAVRNPISQWLRGRCCPRTHSDKYHEVVRLADEAAATARVLNEQMQPYIDSSDPLIALMTDLHNRRIMDGAYGLLEDKK